MKDNHIEVYTSNFLDTVPDEFSDIISEVFDEEDGLTKRCAKCQKDLSISKFSYLKSRKNFSYYCTKCSSKIAKKSKDKLAPYHWYKDYLTIEEKPIKDDFGNLLVKCKFCKKYFVPTRGAVYSRLLCLYGVNSGESSLYCSDECKGKCPVYKSHGNIKAPSKRDSSFIKQANEMSLKRAGNKCEICESTENLEVHHIKPFKTDPIEAYDIDNLIVLCKKHHHKYGHSDKECTTGYLKKCVPEY